MQVLCEWINLHFSLIFKYGNLHPSLFLNFGVKNRGQFVRKKILNNSIEKG